MNIALVYDRVNSYGGAEKVLQALHEIWPDAPLFTSVCNSTAATWANDFDVRTSFLQQVPGAKSRHQWLAAVMPYAFESLDLSDYEVVISITSAEAKGIVTRPDQLHLCYMLTPTRYLWSHTHEYAGSGVAKAMRLPFLCHLRRWDQVAAQRPDVMIGISRTVARRIEKYYRRNVQSVIYPGVEYDYFSESTNIDAVDEYYLVVARMVGYKQTQAVIEAFARQKKRKLKVVGAGKQLDTLKRSQPENVQFLGFVSKEKLRDLYQAAQGLIFPQEEDFGIVALEAQAAGIPVLAYKMGGATETVIHAKTGYLFEDNSSAGIMQAIDDFEKIEWKSGTIRRQAEKFDINIFKQTFTNQVEELWQTHKTKNILT